jgi:hypothetical protein
MKYRLNPAGKKWGILSLWKASGNLVSMNTSTQILTRIADRIGGKAEPSEPCVPRQSQGTSLRERWTDWRSAIGIVVASTLFFCFQPALPAQESPQNDYDVVIYGGTSGGIAAAIQVKRMGHSVVIIEPTQFVGGLTTGGLGATDIGNKRAIGGIAREFYRRIHRYYQDKNHWTQESYESYTKGRTIEDSMWTFEPSAALAVYRGWIDEADVPVVYSERLNRSTGVIKDQSKILKIVMESGRAFSGKVFIDASYEGDLMASAGVTYTVGREANSTYGETLNGLQKERSIQHQFIRRVDPFRIPGNPQSGLLPGVVDHPQGNDGDADHRVQAYCFRLCTTDVPENRLAWPKPTDYDESRYELLLRNFEAGDTRIPWHPIWMPNRKTDTNNNFAISTDYLGMNYKYPDGDYATRERIWKDHESYTQGLMWTLANHPRVPPSVRDVFQTIALAKDEFLDNNHWPRQLYIREARRMVSDYVMSEKNCRRQEVVPDSVGMGAYNMDSHNTMRYVTPEGWARNEGDIQYPSRPYPISYRSLCPRESECNNLLVPVCLAASHIAYGSIRMEPVFMVMGQSAATAAVHSIREKTSAQRVDYVALQKQLLQDSQVLDFSSDPLPVEVSIPKSKMQGVVVDDSDVDQADRRFGFTSESRSVSPFVGSGYVHDGNTAKGEQRIRFQPRLPATGFYKVYMTYTAANNRATNTPVQIQHSQGTENLLVDQKKKAPQDGYRFLLGRFRFEQGESGFVEVRNDGTDGHVVVDAIQWIAD